MLRVALLLLIAAIGSLWIAGTVAEAKGPAGKVTISGGDLRSEVVIERPDLVPIETDGFLEISVTPPAVYAQGVEIAGETPYVVSIFLLEGSDNVPQLFLSGNYFPSNSDHPDLFSDGGSLWKVQPQFATLLDVRIESALTSGLPKTGGPPASGRSEIWEYALIALGMTFLGGSGLAFALARKR